MEEHVDIEYEDGVIRFEIADVMRGKEKDEGIEGMDLVNRGRALETSVRKVVGGWGKLLTANSDQLPLEWREFSLVLVGTLNRTTSLDPYDMSYLIWKGEDEGEGKWIERRGWLDMFGGKWVGRCRVLMMTRGKLFFLPYFVKDSRW